MNPARALLASALLLAALAAGAPARGQALQPVPALSARVTDQVGMLTGEQRAQLESELAAIEQRKGSQIVALIVATTAPEAIEPYAVRVFEAWKIGRGVVDGKRVDDGVLIVVARDDRRMRIEVGYGLEGAIPDALAKRIIDESMTPRFKRGDWFGGLHAGVVDLARLLEGEELPPPQRAAGDDSSPSDWLGPAIGVFVLGMVARAILGKFLGSLAGGGGAGVVAASFGASLVVALALGLFAFIALLLFGTAAAGLQQRGRHTYRSGGHWGGGGWGGGGMGGGGGGFGGGGGSSGGGGASGGW